ncbi:hypothetical protein ACFPT7_12370 [Acidicapsa dinghuensis]|uniref:Uncharacterized protein n=1 Tax=Acidicapsa dinghuensis TaxID=2218256 RepID=A0ABW1EFJ6_9BACT|nr:hypothetical protein [Acidicapsa dinghuensis]
MKMRSLIGFCCVTAVWIGGTLASPGEAPSPASGKHLAPSSALRQKQAEPAALPAIDPAHLVREVVYNELHDHDSHGYWRYWIEKHSSRETQLQEEVETPEGPVSHLELTNGKPPSADEQQEENSRLEHLLTSPGAQAQHRKEYAEDENRIGRILALLPDAFLYERISDETNRSEMRDCPCYHFHFQPNPNYPTHSIESRIFHAMAGDLWIGADNKRLVRLDGVLQDNVDFGYGILGRLYKGGWFRLERTRVTANGGAGDWKTRKLEVHMNGRAMLFKTIARETSEVRGGFTPVPPGLSLQQAAALAREPVEETASQPATIQPTAFVIR